MAQKARAKGKNQDANKKNFNGECSHCGSGDTRKKTAEFSPRRRRSVMGKGANADHWHLQHQRGLLLD